jgi:hypothetical protein
METVGDEAPRITGIEGLGQPEGRRRHDVTRLARIGQHLVDVCIDVDRRLPSAVGILRSQDPADVHVREQGAVGTGGERSRVGRSSPRRVPALPARRVVERRRHLDGSCTRHRQPSVRGADQDPVRHGEQASSELFRHRRHRLDGAAAESDHVTAVRQRPPPLRARREGRDLAAVQPRISAVPEQPVPSSDDPSHEP